MFDKSKARYSLFKLGQYSKSRSSKKTKVVPASKVERKQPKEICQKGFENCDVSSISTSTSPSSYLQSTRNKCKGTTNPELQYSNNNGPLRQKSPSQTKLEALLKIQSRRKALLHSLQQQTSRKASNDPARRRQIVIKWLAKHQPAPNKLGSAIVREMELFELKSFLGWQVLEGAQFILPHMRSHDWFFLLKARALFRTRYTPHTWALSRFFCWLLKFGLHLFLRIMLELFS